MCVDKKGKKGSQLTVVDDPVGRQAVSLVLHLSRFRFDGARLQTKGEGSGDVALWSSQVAPDEPR